MVAPVTIRYQNLPTDVPRTTLVVAVIDEPGTGSTVKTGEATRITSANLDAIGKDGMLLDAYNHLTARANLHYWAVPLDLSGDDAADLVALNAAIDVLSNDATKEAMGGFGPDMVVLRTLGTPLAAPVAEVPIARASGHAISDRWAAVFVNASFTGAGDATQEALTAWVKANAAPAVLPMLNKGSGSTPGRVLAAEHYARYIGQHDFGVNPVGVSFHAADVGLPDPHLIFSVEKATAPANVLAAEGGSLFVRYAGDAFLWGGKLATAANQTALDTVGHRLVAKRFAEQTVQAGFPLVGQRVTLNQLEGLQNTVQNLAREYVDQGEAESIVVRQPRIVAGVIKHASSIRFFDTADAYELDVEVGHAEVAA